MSTNRIKRTLIKITGNKNPLQRIVIDTKQELDNLGMKNSLSEFVDEIINALYLYWNSLIGIYEGSVKDIINKSISIEILQMRMLDVGEIINAVKKSINEREDNILLRVCFKKIHDIKFDKVHSSNLLKVIQAAIDALLKGNIKLASQKCLDDYACPISYERFVNPTRIVSESKDAYGNVIPYEHFFEKSEAIKYRNRWIEDHGPNQPLICPISRQRVVHFNEEVDKPFSEFLSCFRELYSKGYVINPCMKLPKNLYDHKHNADVAPNDDKKHDKKVQLSILEKR